MMKKFVLILLLVLAAGVKPLFAQEPQPQTNNIDVNALFDSRVSYDIYFRSGESNTNIAHSVEILRFENIAGKTFLVVKSSGFNLDDQEGFILFDSISAILPDQKINVRQTKKR